MDYSKLSNFEINKRVFTALRGKKPLGYPHNADGRSVGNESNDQYTWHDYCKNPADAWPIIVENGIGIRKQSNSLWCVSRQGGLYPQYNENPLRAAMIVFLLMQESANVQGNPA